MTAKTDSTGAKYCDQRICMSLCLTARVSEKPHVDSVRVTRSYGSIFLFSD